MRQGLAWSGAFLCSVAVTFALVGASSTATPPGQPGLVTAPGRQTAQEAAGPGEISWLAQGSVPGRGTRWEQMNRTALLDLHRLSRPNGAVAAGPAGIWSYSWPRDTAFVAVALARTGHHGDARQSLAFLQRVQRADGGFEARYLMDGSGPPDDREGQSDGAGWALWAAWEVSQSAREVGAPQPSRVMLDRATRFLLDVTDDGRQLPDASPDYWEVGVSRTSLGTAAPILAGLQASQRMYAALGEPALADRSGVAASRLLDLIDDRFAGGWERFGSPGRRDGGGLDAAVTFMMPPFAQSPSSDLVTAWLRYQSVAERAAGGLAPGAQWKQDGISWTPETALVAYTAAMNGRPETSAHWLDWLDDHRTPWGSLPEKVLASGAPAGAAPLAWTAALVVLTTSELEGPDGS